MGVSPEVAILAVLLCAPLALAGRRADRLVELWNERLAIRAGGARGRASRRGDPLEPLRPRRAVRDRRAPRSGGRRRRRRDHPGVPPRGARRREPLRLGFFAFAALACASGAKALRAREAPRFFYGALAVALAAGVLVGRALS